jgi:hypothetical protein
MVRLDESGDSIAFGEMVTSNHRTEDYQLFVNIPPGRYLVVAVDIEWQQSSGGLGGGFSAGVSVTNTNWVTGYLPEDAIRSMLVEVTPDALVFAGALDLGIDEADPAQNYYYRRIAPEHAARTGVIRWMGRLMDRSYHYRAVVRSLDQSDGARDALVASVVPKLAEEGWGDLRVAGASLASTSVYSESGVAAQTSETKPVGRAPPPRALGE